MISRSDAPAAEAPASAASPNCTGPAASGEPVNSIWIGKRGLGPTQLLAIRSFQAAGYRFALWTHERESLDLPEGVETRDARELLPSSAAFKLKGGTHHGSLAFFCDVLQLHGLYRRGGLWVHLDAECLKPLGEREFVFARHWDGDEGVCTYALKAPAGHEAIAEAIVEAATVDRENYHWHDMMRSLGRVVKRRGLPVLTTADGFHDDRDRHENFYYRDRRPDGDRYIHHWCHSYTGRFRSRPRARSYYLQRLAKYGITFER